MNIPVQLFWSDAGTQSQRSAESLDYSVPSAETVEVSRKVRSRRGKREGARLVGSDWRVCQEKRLSDEERVSVP